jgi:hypothetical protein
MDIYLLLIVLGVDLPFFGKNEKRNTDEKSLPPIDLELLSTVRYLENKDSQPVANSGLRNAVAQGT